MSEYTVGTSITIGGNLSHDLLKELCDALDDDLNNIVGYTDPTHFKLKLGQEPCNIWQGTAPYGNCPTVINFCRKYKLSFKIESEANGESDGSIVFWLPNMKNPITTYATQESLSTVRVSRIKPYFELLLAMYLGGNLECLPLYIDHKELGPTVINMLHKNSPIEILTNRIEEICPTIPDIPDLIIT